MLTKATRPIVLSLAACLVALAAPALAAPFTAGNILVEQLTGTSNALKSDGTVQDNNYKTIGYARGVRKDWVAVLYFFFNN